MTREDAWLAAVIRKAETTEECKLIVTQYLLGKNGGQLQSLSRDTETPTSQFPRLSVVPPVTDNKNATM